MLGDDDSGGGDGNDNGDITSTASCRGRGAILGDRAGLPFLFTMARLDSVKNLVGLARLFARSERLRACCNLFIVGGDVRKGRRQRRRRKEEEKEAAAENDKNNNNNNNEEEEEEEDGEEVPLARALHELFDSNQLPHGTARWVSAQSNAVSNGELYRVVADSRGAFVQPALFENFGLTCVFFRFFFLSVSSPSLLRLFLFLCLFANHFISLFFFQTKNRKPTTKKK